jgi:hypothetical protein
MKEFYTQNEDGTFSKAGYEFTGFPANGIWLVKDGSQNCIYPVKGVPETPTPTLISYMQFQDELQKHISEKWENKALSVRDISEIACEFFAVKAGAMKIGETLIEN